MKLANALVRHAWLALSLRHDGSGMPKKVPAAFMLVAVYIALSLANGHISGDLSVQSFVAYSFILQFYIFFLRDKVVGLILMVGIITNAFSLALSPFAGMAEVKHLMLLIMEFAMIFGAIINIIGNMKQTSD
jgi:hypothetical protein